MHGSRIRGVYKLFYRLMYQVHEIISNRRVISCVLLKCKHGDILDFVSGEDQYPLPAYCPKTKVKTTSGE